LLNIRFQYDAVEVVCVHGNTLVARQTQWQVIFMCSYTWCWRGRHPHWSHVSFSQIGQVRRLSKAKAHHGSDSEKRRRKLEARKVSGAGELLVTEEWRLSPVKTAKTSL